METDTIEEQPQPEQGFLPKPVFIEDKKNWVRKSMISLAIYAFLFFVVFDMEAIYIAAVLVVLLIHEFGHFFAMKLFNYSNVKLFIIPLLGAYVSGKKSIISQRQLSIIILAGPVPGIIIGFCLLMSTNYYPNEKLEMLGNIFVGLNCFNLLPFVPLDGGKLLQTLFINHNHTIRVVFTVISILLLLVFAIVSRNIFFLLIPATMIFELLTEIKNEKIRVYLQQEHVNFTTEYENLPNKSYWTIRDCILLSFHKRYNGIQAGVQQYSIIESAVMNHVMAILKPVFIKDVKDFGKILFVLLFMFFLLLPLVYYIPKVLAAALSAV